jgi:hypothetical protein
VDRYFSGKMVKHGGGCFFSGPVPLIVTYYLHHSHKLLIPGHEKSGKIHAVEGGANFKAGVSIISGI